jgi:hypothetical protein
VIFAALAVAARSAGGIFAWHVTDPHIDPFYTAGAPTSNCYCRAHKKCPARPSSASCQAGGSGGAGIFGDAEADCETPQNLLTSSLAYASEMKPAVPIVLFTGDFCAYMLETPCNNSAQGVTPGSSRYGLLECITDAYNSVKAAFPNALVLPSLGNHDTVVLEYAPGKSAAAFASSEAMNWLYAPVADLWAQPQSIGCSNNPKRKDLFSCAEANRTLLLGGYYATRLSLGTMHVTVLSLNTNYWSLDSNPALADTKGEAYLLGQGMFDWAESQLAQAAVRGDKAIILGHIPPVSCASKDACHAFFFRFCSRNLITPSLPHSLTPSLLGNVGPLCSTKVCGWQASTSAG